MSLIPLFYRTYLLLEVDKLNSCQLNSTTHSVSYNSNLPMIIYFVSGKQLQKVKKINRNIKIESQLNRNIKIERQHSNIINQE